MLTNGSDVKIHISAMSFVCSSLTCVFGFADVDECESPSAVRNKRASGSEEVEIVLDRQKRSAGK